MWACFLRRDTDAGVANGKDESNRPSPGLLIACARDFDDNFSSGRELDRVVDEIA